MKRIILSLIVLGLFNSITYSQDTVRIYLDNNYVKTDKEKASIVRKAIFIDNHYHILDQYLNGTMINYGEFGSVDPFIEDGLSKHYDEYGKLYSTGKYVNGKLSGKWIYFGEKKTDTVDYSIVENFYKQNRDSINITTTNISKNETSKLVEDIQNSINNDFNIPARAREDNLNITFNIKAIIDTSGKILNPQIINSFKNDLDDEMLRTLLIYRNNTKIKNPVDLSFQIVINKFKVSNDEPTFLVVEEPATFQGGDINTFRNWVSENLVYPKEAAKNKIEGKVYIQFAVNSKGKVVDIKIVRGIDTLLEKEAVRCLASSPLWEPGKQGGKAIKQQFNIPIVFRLK